MNATLDPTLEAVESLRDEKKWKIVPNVPIFIPHTRKDENGQPKYHVTEADLKEIANVCNARARAGALGKIQIGHTIRDQYGDDGFLRKTPEHEQPELVGVFKDYKVGRFGPEQKPALLVNLYYRRDKFDHAKTYPFRSVEYYNQAKEITALALLRKDPDLDMGMLLFSRDLGPCDYYSSKGLPMTESLSEEVIPDEDEEMDEEYSRKFMGAMKKHFPKLVEQYGCGPGMASSTSVVVPQGVGKNGEPHMETEMHHSYERTGANGAAAPNGNGTANGTPKPPDPLVRENGELLSKVDQYARRIEALEAERKADVQAIHYERQLRAFDPDGQIIAIDKELAALRKMPEEQAKAYLETLDRATQYSRSPVGQPLVRVDGQPVARTGPCTAYEKNAVADYVTAENEKRDAENKPRMTFGEGLAEFRKQGLK